jgi:hypothetical protein
LNWSSISAGAPCGGLAQLVCDRTGLAPEVGRFLLAGFVHVGEGLGEVEVASVDRFGACRLRVFVIEPAKHSCSLPILLIEHDFALGHPLLLKRRGRLWIISRKRVKGVRIVGIGEEGA